MITLLITFAFLGSNAAGGGDLSRLLSHSKSELVQDVSSEYVSMPGFKCSETETQNGGVSVYYPSALDDTYPIVSFLHGSGSGQFVSTCSTIASYGMVVVAVHQGTCGDWSMQQSWAVLGAKQNQDLSPAFSKVNYNIVGLAGHSQGAAYTMGTAAYYQDTLNIVAAVASHGQSANAAPNMSEDMAFMFNAGTSDPKTHKLWWAYQDVKSRPKVFYNLYGAAHMEPAHGGVSNEFMALFLACHTIGRPDFCARIYGDGPDSMSHKYPASVDIQGADFTTTAAPGTQCRCSDPVTEDGNNELKCSNGETWHCSAGQICYASEPFSYGQWADGCATPSSERQPVPNGGACDWGLPEDSQNCEFCSQYYDPRYGNNDGGKCVWVASQNHCMPKNWAQQQGWDIQEFCTDAMCTCTSPGNKADDGMKCTNGESRSCGEGQICYSAEPFHYGAWADGCASVGSSKVVAAKVAEE